MDSETQDNPYQSPGVEEEPAAREAKLVEIDRRRVVCLPVTTLPERCFYCNEPGSESSVLSKNWWFCRDGIISIRVKWFMCSFHEKQMRQTILKGFFAGISISLPLILVVATEDYTGEWLNDNLIWLVVGSWSIAALVHLLRRKRKFCKPQMATIVRGNLREVHIANAGKPFLDSLAGGEEGFRVQ